MGEEDLEFTEEDMFSHLDRGAPNHNAGKENIPNLNRLSEKPKSEKLKRQRSNIPEAQEVEAASSPDNEMSRRKSLEETNPVTSHFRDAAGPSQSMAINTGRDLTSRSRRSTDLDGPDKHVSRLGTSMPITIPGMEKAMAERIARENDEELGPTQFVPPHLLDADEDPMRAHSVNSGSLSSGSIAKRDRLLQRNKILRRTGFLEGSNVEQGKAGSGALPELMDPLNRRLMPIRESYKEQSALSAALGTPRKDSLS